MLVKILCVLLIFKIAPSTSQTVSNVNLLQIKTYMLKVIEETVHDLEDFGWCNLKIPDFTNDLQYQLFGNNFTGSVEYKNGFVSTVQHVDVVDSSLQQTWLWDNVRNASYVRLRGQMRLHDLVIGFDVEALFGDLRRLYTSKFLHRLISFDFEIRTYMDDNNETFITVAGVHPRSTNKMIFMPSDEYSEILSTLYDVESTKDAVSSWATQILEPITTDVVVNKVPFPNICYNCPA